MKSFAKLVTVYTVPLLLSPQGAEWGQKIGLLFGGLCGLYLIPSFFLYPETKSRPYHEIDTLYELRISPRKVHKTKVSEVREDGVGGAA